MKCRSRRASRTRIERVSDGVKSGQRVVAAFKSFWKSVLSGQTGIMNNV